MRRRLPYLTPASLIFALILLLGLGFAFWKTGGPGINPGTLSAKSLPGVTIQGVSSHADIEKNCLNCHKPPVFSQARLCLDGHTDIAQQVAAHEGFHGSLASNNNCAACYPEHRGRDFDPTTFALAGFKHSQTRFTLSPTPTGAAT